MKFSELRKGNLIARVENYKVESAKVLSIERHGKEEYILTVKGTETKKNYKIKVLGRNTTMCGFGDKGPERYYADGSIVSALRDGIVIGFDYARRQITESFKPINPFFTVNGKSVEYKTKEIIYELL